MFTSILRNSRKTQRAAPIPLLRKCRSWNAIVLLFATAIFAAADPVVVAPTVTPTAGGYEYAFTITNNTPDDPFIIDIPVPADPAAISDLTAPLGFRAAFDSGLGLVSFLEDSSNFTSTPQSGFSFDSSIAPGVVPFQATVLSSTSGDLYTISGPTMAPVPEPAHASLWFLPVFAWMLMRRRHQLRSLRIQE
jgi:hypothetical protein